MNVSEIIKQFGGIITVEHVICLAGILLFGNWLLKTSFGRNALADSLPRRNNMPAYMPLIPLSIWFLGVWLVMSITKKLLPALPEWQSTLLDNLTLCIGAIAAIAVILLLARASFAQRLKGFGLNFKTIHKDFLAAVVNLLSVWPLVLFTLLLTIIVGQLIWGHNFQIQRHEELQSIAEYPQLSVRVLIIITAVVVVPAFEEMLFRGLFQTIIRSFLAKPWLTIVINSGLFAMVHANTGHWPALFVLSMCMGYAYEKSGSLFRPIFIHSLFNATSIIAALNQ